MSTVDVAWRLPTQSAMQPTLDRILSPVDESPLSVRAFEYALAIAKWRTARLSVLEVIDWTLPPVAGA